MGETHIVETTPQYSSFNHFLLNKRFKNKRVSRAGVESYYGAAIKAGTFGISRNAKFFCNFIIAVFQQLPFSAQFALHLFFFHLCDGSNSSSHREGFSAKCG